MGTQTPNHGGLDGSERVQIDLQVFQSLIFRELSLFISVPVSRYTLLEKFIFINLTENSTQRVFLPVNNSYLTVVSFRDDNKLTKGLKRKSWGMRCPQGL